MKKIDRINELDKLSSILEQIDLIECPECGGSGEVIIGENLVTEDMASDAGCPEMSGSFHSYVYAVCPLCDGSGKVNKNL